MEEDIDISEHEVHKFLLIFHAFAETINSDQPQEKIDSFVTDTILQIVNVLVPDLPYFYWARYNTQTNCRYFQS